MSLLIAAPSWPTWTWYRMFVDLLFDIPGYPPTETVQIAESFDKLLVAQLLKIFFPFYGTWGLGTGVALSLQWLTTDNKAASIYARSKTFSFTLCPVRPYLSSEYRCQCCYRTDVKNAWRCISTASHFMTSYLIKKQDVTLGETEGDHEDWWCL